MKKYNITVNGITYEVVVEETSGTVSAEGIESSAPVYTPAPTPVKTAAPVQKPSEPAAKPAASGGSGSIKISAPMPGTILKINVSLGQTIKKDDLVCVLEAMKMENEIFAAEGGTVASINASQGASVNSGDVIITLN